MSDYIITVNSTVDTTRGMAGRDVGVPVYSVEIYN